MKKILLIFKKDFKNRMKSPYAVLVLLFIPFLMTAILGLVFSPGEQENALPKIKVLVVDKDKNIASKFLIQAFETPQMKDMFHISIVTEEEGKKLIAKGKASALIIIPKDFSDNILHGKKSQFRLIKNPSEQFLPVIVEEFMNTFAVIVSGFVQVFAEEINGVRLLTETPMENISITDMTPFLEKSRLKIIALQDYLDPLLIQLKEEVKGKEKEEKKEPGFNIFGLILPAISIMFLLFIVEIFLRDILSERENGILQRIMFSAVRPVEYILAKMFSGVIMGMLAYFIIVLAGILIFDMSWGNYLYLLVLITVTCFWIACFFALVHSFFKNKNQAGGVTSAIVIVFSAFGGSMIPVDQMPAAFQQVSRFTLNYWFIKGAETIKQGDFPTLPLLIILSTAVILFFFAIMVLTGKGAALPTSKRAGLSNSTGADKKARKSSRGTGQKIRTKENGD